MTDMTKVETHLLTRKSEDYSAYYNGKMSYRLHGEAWRKYVEEAFPDMSDMQTSENVFKTVIDLYAENLVPVPDELRGFSNILVPLLCRGEAPVVVLRDGTVSYPEHYEMISDGTFSVAAVYTRSLKTMQDYVTYIYSDGTAKLYTKDVPDDFSPPNKEGYQFDEQTVGNHLFRFALDDKGFGATLAALQDRFNHSIIDQTVVAEMYARPFWYLLNVDIVEKNPYLPPHVQPDDGNMKEQKLESAGRIFTTSGDGPFGQLTPPTIQDMIAYHDSIVDKAPQSFGIPAHYFKPGSGAPPTGVALKVLSKRFNNKIARMRDDLTPELERLSDLLGVEKTAEVKVRKKKDETEPEEPQEERETIEVAPGEVEPTEGAPVATPEPEEDEEEVTYEYEFWNTSDDLLQESLDAHGIALSTMGYPLEYIAEVVTPGVDLDDYQDDGFNETQMDADQIASYAQDPGQLAGQPAINPPPTPPAVA